MSICLSPMVSWCLCERPEVGKLLCEVMGFESSVSGALIAVGGEQEHSSYHPSS